MSQVQSGTIANVPADSAATAAGTFPVPFASGSTPNVSLTILNPSTWDGYQLSIALVGTPTNLGFNVIVSGGAAASTVSVMWQASGAAPSVTSTAGSTPQGLSGLAAITEVQNYANEPTLPTPATILTFLNKGVEEVVRRIGGIRLWAPYPTVSMQSTVQLNDDVQDIISANFSMGNANAASTGSASPFAQGALVYPMEQLEQKMFMDAAAGFPAVGFGPPQAYFVYQDTGTAPTTVLPVPPQVQLAFVEGAGSGATIEAGVTYVNAYGETPLSTVADVTFDAGDQGQAQSPPGVSNATGYNAYAGAIGGPYYLQNSAPVALGTPFTLPNPLLTGTAQAPSNNTATGAGTGGALWMQLYPAAMIGQVNIYYRARPMLWADTTANSWTNLDTSAQEAVVLFAVMRVLSNRGRAAENAPWRTEYEALITSMQESVQRRTVPRSGQVRDVRNRSFASSPFWMR